MGMFIMSARDEVFDFSYPTLEAGLQIMVRDTHQAAATANPLWDLLRLIFSRTTVAWLGMALLLVLIPGSRGLVARTAARGRCDFEP